MSEQLSAEQLAGIEADANIWQTGGWGECQMDYETVAALIAQAREALALPILRAENAALMSAMEIERHPQGFVVCAGQIGPLRTIEEAIAASGQAFESRLDAECAEYEQAIDAASESGE